MDEDEDDIDDAEFNKQRREKRLKNKRSKDKEFAQAEPQVKTQRINSPRRRIRVANIDLDDLDDLEEMFYYSNDY